MYANYHIYIDLIELLEKHSLGWEKDMSSTDGKRFVDRVSKALVQCGLAMWKALNIRHSSGALFPFLFL
jgi:hypothetical protein